jgi:acyl CoA:acetate/3-ketoacid CoA transferase alpha subunit
MKSKISEKSGRTLEGLLPDRVRVTSDRFGLSENSESVTPAISREHFANLTVIANNADADSFGYRMLGRNPIGKLMSSCVGETMLLELEPGVPVAVAKGCVALNLRGPEQVS